MQKIAKSTLGSILFLTALSLGTLFFRLGSLPLSGNDEPRYARIAEEMHLSGSWVTPTLQDRPWLEKPPLYYWATIPFNALIESKETAARFAPALFAFIAALAILWLGRTLYSRLSGLIGASILLTSLGFTIGGRTAATDMPFTCCLTLGMAFLAAGVKRDPGRLKILAAYLFLGLAVLGKGPIAIILATGTGLSFWYFNENGNVLHRWRIWRGLLVMSMVSVPWFWFAFKENGYAFITTFFVNHNLARYITDIHHHTEPFYYYLPVILLLLFPWSGWLAFVLNKASFKDIRRWRDWDPRMLYLACWALFPLLFFSLSGSKLAGYILPSLPPISLILGVHISEWVSNSSKGVTLKIATILSLVFSTVLAVASHIYFIKYDSGSWKLGLLLSIVFVTPAILALLFGIRGQSGKAFLVTVIQGFLIIVIVVQFAVPVLGKYLSAKEISGIVLESMHTGEPVVTYGITDHSLDYYTGYRIAGKADNPASLERLLQENGQILVVTEARRVKGIRSIDKIYTEVIGKQGNLRLLRLTRN
ncbi:MAG: glycosyltransferase family 39 protein [Acidobacteriota bacterium]